MTMSRRTLGMSLLALAAPVRAVQMTCGGDWEDDPSYWPRGVVDPLIADISSRRIRRLYAGLTKNPTREQLEAHHSAIYPQTIEQGFARMSGKRMRAYFALASDFELAELARLYRIALNTQSRTGLLLPVLAARADDAELLRVAKAFGTLAIYEALAHYAPQRLATFELLTRGNVIMEPPVNQTFTPTLDMTITRIYQGFRSAPIGASSVAASLYQTGIYAGTHLATAWGIGYAVGTTYVLPLVQQYFPSIYDSLGSGINTIMQGLTGGLLGTSVPAAMEGATYDFQVTPYASLLEQTGGDYGVVEEWSVAAGYSGGGC